MAVHRLKACLITNPRAGRGGTDLADALSVLEAHGWECTVRQKLHGGHATELARAAALDGCHVVVNCAGDGTLSEIVDGMVGTDVAVGVLPGGTVNLWASEIGVSSRLRAAAYQMLGAARYRVDVGHVEINGRQGRHFLLMAGIGIDGAIMARASKRLKNRIGRLAIGVAAIQALPTVRTVAVQVEMDGIRWYGQVGQIVVGNTRRYAGLTQITPDAYVDDGLLDVCLFSAMDLAGVGRQCASLLLRQRPDAATAETYRSTSIVIRAPIALPLQTDGGAVRLKKKTLRTDGVAYTFTTVPRAVTMLVPRTYNGALFTRGARAALPALPPITDVADGRDDSARTLPLT